MTTNAYEYNCKDQENRYQNGPHNIQIDLRPFIYNTLLKFDGVLWINEFHIRHDLAIRFFALIGIDCLIIYGAAIGTTLPRLIKNTFVSNKLLT